MGVLFTVMTPFVPFALEFTRSWFGLVGVLLGLCWSWLCS